MVSRIFLFLLATLFSLTTQGQTAQQIIDQLKNQLSCDWANETVDTFKSGDPNEQVTGVLCCMFADMQVLQEAVAKNCNLIITHEPVFYNHLDETKDLQYDPVLQDKLAYIKAHELIIWRFHDHWHRHQPDGIYVGMLDKLGWANQTVANHINLVKTQSQSLKDLAHKLQSVFEIPGIRVIGDPALEVSKIGLALGAPGAKRQIALLQDVDVIIAGEAQEWETYQYINDAVMQGKPKAVIFLGHLKSEEAGMAYLSEWMTSFIKGVPIHFSENQVPYWTPNEDDF
ncbi:Nif3-like dinuclear metal center hexameric protein [uncultured Sunxiuqinia sp.]|uniref:Nif3-like dinuclear metal center hexameric protein n=1 Tax=uncultured Sunxiuqinia sp. TaxID=1573825 RepID=UPI002610EA00|nr:Nif3-like dinuclear metal center hexameric protein [uncultured Sunxiuqinia sp.]